MPSKRARISETTRESEIRTEAIQRRDAGIANCPVIIGSDKDEKAVGAARRNIVAAGFESVIRVYLHDATEPLKKSIRKYLEHGSGLIVCNPPYGKRLGEQQVLRSVYMRFGKQLRKEFPGWTVAVITSPVRHLGSHFSFCSSLPNWWM